MRKEVLPYSGDAWYVAGNVRVGYEINFNRFFYRPEPLRSLEEIRADIHKINAQTRESLTEVLIR